MANISMTVSSVSLLLLISCFVLSPFGDGWMASVPAMIHGSRKWRVFNHTFSGLWTYNLFRWKVGTLRTSLGYIRWRRIVSTNGPSTGINFNVRSAFSLIWNLKITSLSSCVLDKWSSSKATDRPGLVYTDTVGVESFSSETPRTQNKEVTRIENFLI